MNDKTINSLLAVAAVVCFAIAACLASIIVTPTPTAKVRECEARGGVLVLGAGTKTHCVAWHALKE